MAEPMMKFNYIYISVTLKNSTNMDICTLQYKLIVPVFLTYTGGETKNKNSVVKKDFNKNLPFISPLLLTITPALSLK